MPELPNARLKTPPPTFTAGLHNREHLPEGGNRVVVIVAGDSLAEFSRPFLAGLRSNFIKAKVPKSRPGGFNLLEAQPPVFFAPRFDRRVAFEVPIEEHHRFIKSWCGDMPTRLDRKGGRVGNGG